MDIPVSFEYEGKRYDGVLSKVSGAATQMYHLNVKGYYCGQLFLTVNGWRFSSQSGKLDHLANVFINAIMKHE
jgi:hypothetical protein